MEEARKREEKRREGDIEGVDKGEEREKRERERERGRGNMEEAGEREEKGREGVDLLAHEMDFRTGVRLGCTKLTVILRMTSHVGGYHLNSHSPDYFKRLSLISNLNTFAHPILVHLEFLLWEDYII